MGLAHGMSPSRTSPIQLQVRATAVWWALTAALLCRRRLYPGELLHAPGLTLGEAKRLKVLQQRLARAKRGSHRREKTKRAIAKLRVRERDRRKDWVEKTTTDLAQRSDLMRVEQLNVQAMTRSARGTIDRQARESRRSVGSTARSAEVVGASFPRRLQHKAFGRVERVPALSYTFATLLHVRARRAREPQEPSGLRVRVLLRYRTVQR